MSSDFNRLASESGRLPQTYEYPAPMGTITTDRMPPTGAEPSTLERLWNTEKPAAPPPPPGVSEDQVRAREARARREGRDEGLAQAKAELEKRLAAEKQVVAQTVQDFARERANYYQRVESEVVTLALAIARKILHRESQIDPLLLAGVVRVGLENVSSGTRVRLRVHPDQVRAWQEFLSHQTDLRAVPELMGDSTINPGHCSLETEMGTTDLTLESQLKEIQQGFFDLLAHTPKEQ